MENRFKVILKKYSEGSLIELLCYDFNSLCENKMLRLSDSYDQMLYCVPLKSILYIETIK
jgi:hypothetical protein